MRFYAILLFLLLLSLTSYCVKWPFNWHDGGLVNWKRRRKQHEEIIKRVAESDSLLLEVADVVIELRTSAERLEQALKRLQEEEDEENNG